MPVVHRRSSPIFAWCVVACLGILGVVASTLADGPKDGRSKSATSKSSPPTSAGKTTGAKLDFIDRMIREGWASASIKPSPLAPDDEFMRRAYLDVLGRIPNLSEAKAFLGNKEPGKRAKLVEYLLAHEDYEKNFANQWKIVLIGRQNQGQNIDEKALRDWLRQKFAKDRPWNEIAFELITASGNNKTNGSANYVMSHLENGAVPLTSVTTRVFLGQQIQCTQCHDHPSNDWKQADFWGINAFLKGIKTEQIRVETASGASVVDHVELSDVPTDVFVSFERRDARMGVVPPTFLDGRKVSPNKDVNRREALGRFITEPANDSFAKAFVNRMWGHFLGRGFVHPVDDFGAHNPASHPELLDKMAAEFKASGYNIKLLIRWIMNSEAYHLTSRATATNDKDESLFTHMALKPFTPEQLFDSLLVATAAHKAGGGGDNAVKRNEWLKQFQFAFGNDEGEEGTSFQGTIPQALMMMNGDLMNQAVGGKPGSFLSDLLETARGHGGAVDVYIVDHLYLAALSRHPGRAELEAASMYFNSFPDTIQVMEDLFWALLNSNEFVLNR
jgi:hypothetical protein